MTTRQKRGLWSFLAAIAVVGLVVVAMDAEAGRLSPELAAMIDPATCTGECRTTPVPVIILMRMQVDLEAIVDDQMTNAERRAAILNALRQMAAWTQNQAILAACGSSGRPGLLDELIQLASEVTNIEPLWIVNAVAAAATPDVINRLAARADVGEVSYGGEVAYVGGGAPLTAAAATSGTPPGWNLDVTGVRNARAAVGVDGAGAAVGIIGTGVDWTHEALRDNVVTRDDGTPLWKNALAAEKWGHSHFLGGGGP